MSWKEAEVIPLPKKNNPTNLCDYRPISILPFLSKVLERLVHCQLNSFLSIHNLLNPLQSGFRVGHSTTTALLKVTDDIRLGMENQQLTVLTLLDFSNAFGAVDFDILLALLRSFNISPTVIDWFHNYLHGRRQRIRVQDHYSSWAPLNAGVPQGGVLSPLLFAIFINSITSHLTSLYHLYADDLQIYVQTTLHDLPKALNTINCEMSCILDWSRSYDLIVNPRKSQVNVIGSSKYITKIDWTQLPDVVYNGDQIPYKKKVKNLGIIMDSFLSWSPHIDEVSRKIFGAVASLRRLKNFLPTATKIMLAQTLLLPIIDYADTCYLNLTEEQLNKLERLQNLCIRFIFGLRKYDHVSQYRSKLKWLPIRLRRNTHLLSALYSVLFNHNAPCYLKVMFKFLAQSHDRTLRSTENLTLSLPLHYTSFYKKSFAVTAVRLWNALPPNIRLAQSFNIFKTLVKQHYLTQVTDLN